MASLGLSLRPDLAGAEHDSGFGHIPDAGHMAGQLLLDVLRRFLRCLAGENGDAAAVASRIAGRDCRIHAADGNVLHADAELLGDDLHQHGVRALAAIGGAGQVIHRAVLAQAQHRRAGLVAALLGAAAHGAGADADAAYHAAAGRLARLAFAPGRLGADGFQRLLDAAGLDVHAVHGGVRRHDRILQAHVEAVQPEFFGHHVHQHLGRKARMGHAMAAHRGAGGVVGEDAIGVVFEVSESCRAAWCRRR
jgi:hypothetical protein